MMMQVLRLSLRSITHAQTFGADLSFVPGLNIIRAGNTSGKSTCLQAIIYALGLERSLGPQLDVPLPYAMRDRIHAQRDDPYAPVLQSFVELAIKNAKGEVLEIRRDIAGGKDKKLIQTQRSGDSSPRDFFVHDAGAAQREDGFHTFLANFIGWDLPLVSRFDGSEGPLYLEAIFPMLFVEQKRGWSAIQGPFPTFLRIQDVVRRVMEFLLDLEAGRIRRLRAELRRSSAAVQLSWSRQRAVVEGRVNPIGRLRGIPADPTAEFAQGSEVTIDTLVNEEWHPLDNVINDLQAEITKLNSVELPSAEIAATDVEKQLARARASLDTLSASFEALRGEYFAEKQEQRAIESRLQFLETDLRRNQDALKLKRLGSELGIISGQSVCPTCHQTVESELLPTMSTVGMGLEENISFVKSQIELYRSAHERAESTVSDLTARYEAVNRELRDTQKEVRNLRQALIQPADSPSIAVVEKIVNHQSRIDSLRAAQGFLDSTIEDMRLLAMEWTGFQDRLRRLSGDDLTGSDQAKVNELELAIQQQLSAYGFKTFQPTEINLSRDNFRPLAVSRSGDEVIEKEINFEVSASDAIRLKWAYYLALLLVASNRPTNHCGLVVFDEPGQQEVDVASLHSFLARSADQVSESQQVIVATSEELESVERALGTRDVNIINFAGFILQPIL